MKESIEKQVEETYTQTFNCNRIAIARSTMMGGRSNVFFMERSGRSDDCSIAYESMKTNVSSRDQVIR